MEDSNPSVAKRAISRVPDDKGLFSIPLDDAGFPTRSSDSFAVSLTANLNVLVIYSRCLKGPDGSSVDRSHPSSEVSADSAFRHNQRLYVQTVYPSRAAYICCKFPALFAKPTGACL